MRLTSSEIIEDLSTVQRTVRALPRDTYAEVHTQSGHTFSGVVRNFDGEVMYITDQKFTPTKVHRVDLRDVFAFSTGEQ